MSPEEYERIKEAEKAHLRELREWKQMARSLERRRSVREALGRIVDGARDLLGRHEQGMQGLSEETAREQARLELALERAAETDLDEAPDLDALDAELARAQARQLLDRLRREAPEAAPDDGSNDGTSAETYRDDLPEKTLGRMRPHRD